MAKKYLNVRYEDRELAKRLGAKWDPALKRWYCPKGSQLDLIFRWRAATVESRVHEPAGNDLRPPLSFGDNFELPLAG